MRTDASAARLTRSARLLAGLCLLIHAARCQTPPDSGCLVSLLAGSPTGAAGQVDAVGTAALFSSPNSVAMFNGTAYVGDQSHAKVRRLLPGAAMAAAYTPSGSGALSVSLTQSGGQPLIITSGTIPLGMQQVWGTWLSTGVSFKICGNSWQVAGGGPWSCVTDNSFFRNIASVATPGGGPIYVFDQAPVSIKIIPGIGAPFAGQARVWVGGGPVVGSLPYTDGVGTGVRFAGMVYGMTISPGGDTLYFADGNFIRRANTATAAVSTLAGCSFGVGFAMGAGTSACFALASTAGLLLAPRWGLLVSDQGNNCLRAVALDGSARVSVVAGQCGGAAGNTLGAAATAAMSSPSGLALAGDGQSIVIVERGTNSVKLLSCPSPSPTPTPSASPSAGFSASPSPTPSASPPFAAGCTVQYLAGGAACNVFADGPAGAATMGNVRGIASLPNGTLVFADGSAHRIRTLSAGAVATLAGSGTPGSLDGPAATGQLNQPFSLALSPSGALLYVACPVEHKVRTVSMATGALGTLAGSGTAGYANGVGGAAAMNLPHGVTVAPSGLLYFTDSGNARIRSIAPDGTVAWLAGSGAAGDQDGAAGVATFTAALVGIGWAPWGLLYVADSHRLRSVSPATGAVSTLAGSPAFGFADGPGLSARFYTLHQLAFDGASGTIFASDVRNGRVRAVSNSTSAVTTLAGSGGGPASGSFGPALAAGVPFPSGLAVSGASGALVLGFAAGAQACQLRSVVCPPLPPPAPAPPPPWPAPPAPGLSPSPSTSLRPTPSAAPAPCFAAAFAGAYGVAGYLEGVGPSGGSAPVPLLSAPAGLAALPSGALALADAGNHRVRALSPGGATGALVGSGAAADTDGVGGGAAVNAPRALAYSGAAGGASLSPRPRACAQWRCPAWQSPRWRAAPARASQTARAPAPSLARRAGCAWTAPAAPCT